MHMASYEELPDNVEARPRGKRSRRPTEEEHLALSLIMLARSRPTKPTSDPPPAQNLPYKCLLCGRGFACYQALGGHKASHKKIPDSSEDRGALADKNVGPVYSRKRGHQCTICVKIFASGQALGGHKRCHYEGGAGGGGAPAMSSSACKGFDLNLPAMEEEEEEEEEVVVGKVKYKNKSRNKQIKPHRNVKKKQKVRQIIFI